ncbi:MAG: chemotaxis protein CheB [Candidatus Eremiobacteraeota bacterium]|nr:chemotaxis protein CheB [Candidatus Eremiobacteraeota bacterium]
MNHQRPRACPALVIGGSAGALDPLRRLVADIPQDFPAAVFVVSHVPAASVSALPHLLARCGALFATHAIDGAPIAPGRIIVAPPDHHVILQEGVMGVLQGPMENNHRPSIDVLFRSAAANCNSGACGVLLSGMRDDGVAGIVAIHDAGGVAFVQDPNEAQFADMPLNAIATGAVDGVYPAERLIDAIQGWLSNSTFQNDGVVAPQDEREAGIPSVFTCPDCGGTLWELDAGSALRFRCRTGHAYSGHQMLASHKPKLESALWASIRALEERRDLLRRLAKRTRQHGEGASTRQFERQAADIVADLERVHAALANFTALASPA